MSQRLQPKTQKQAEEAKSCMKVQNGKDIEHNGQNMFKSQTNPKNQNCQNFVKLNKRKTFEKLSEKILENNEEIGNQGFIYLNILVFYIVWCLWSIYNKSTFFLQTL